MANPDRILLIRLSSVGDLLLASPVVEYLRMVYPRSRITWLVDSGYESLVRMFPFVDEVVVFEHLSRHGGLSGIGRLARELGTFDLVVDLQHKVRTVVLCSLIKSGKKVSLVKRRGIGLVRAMLGRETIWGGPHQVLRNLAILKDTVEGFSVDSFASASVPVPEIEIPSDLLHEARVDVKSKVGQRPLVGIVPDAMHFSKQWPRVYLRDLTNMCLEHGWGVVLLGGRSGSRGAEFVTANIHHECLWTIVGEDLAHLAARLKACSVVVSPDSGPAHISGVLGVPTLVLFGSTSPERWAPLGPRVKIVDLKLACSPCSNHGVNSCPLGTMDCMVGLKPESVFSMIEQVVK